MKALNLLLMVVFTASGAFAQSAKRVDAQDIDALGGNEGVIRMAKALDPENRARIVQKRTVDRNSRFEFGFGYGGVVSGDSYVRTQNLSGSIDFHINPRWSIGARYIDHSNDLTPEGDRVFSAARDAYNAGGRSYVMPDIDPAQRTAFAAVDWYPIYGKTNLFDAAIAQFDVYLTLGAGQVELEKEGWTTMTTAGVGLGLWLNKNWAIRGEFRAQNYTDTIGADETKRNLTSTVASVGIGYLL